MTDPQRGWIEKFTVTRTDGTSAPGLKHDGCEYFVLDLHHDPHARAALLAYAESCAETYPRLAADLRERAAVVPYAASEQSRFFRGLDR